MTHLRFPSSKAEGDKAYQRFVQKVLDLGCEVRKASDVDDIIFHIDCEVNGKSFDVKGMKRISREGEIQDRYHWVEFKDVHGEPGWLFGRATFIAFETQTSFIIVSRTKLIEALEHKPVDHTLVTDPYKALYKSYSRNGRKDEITLVETDWLRQISGREIVC